MKKCVALLLLVTKLAYASTSYQNINQVQFGYYDANGNEQYQPSN